MKKLALFALLAVFTLVLSACGGKSTTKLDVTMTDFKYDMEDYTIAAGKEITMNIKNDGAVLHEFVIMKYGLNIGDVQDVIETAIGGENISTTVEGRRRFPIRVRYFKDYRDDADKLKNILVTVGSSMNNNQNTGMSSTSNQSNNIIKRNIQPG